jgi:hypothetical protein
MRYSFFEIRETKQQEMPFQTEKKKEFWKRNQHDQKNKAEKFDIRTFYEDTTKANQQTILLKIFWKESLRSRLQNQEPRICDERIWIIWFYWTYDAKTVLKPEKFESSIILT